VLDGCESGKHYVRGWSEKQGRQDAKENENRFTRLAYDNDAGYLYLFFRFQPSVTEPYQDQFAEVPLGASLGSASQLLEIEIGPKTATAGAASDEDPRSNVAKIAVGLGSEGFDAGVNYTLSRWDPAKKQFSREVRKEDSSRSYALIAHGRDGIEIALPLRDLGVAPGQTIELAFSRDGESLPSCLIRLK
jgi:hypothetical protein